MSLKYPHISGYICLFFFWSPPPPGGLEGCGGGCWWEIGCRRRAREGIEEENQENKMIETGNRNGNGKGGLWYRDEKGKGKERKYKISLLSRGGGLCIFYFSEAGGG